MKNFVQIGKLEWKFIYIFDILFNIQRSGIANNFAEYNQ